MHSQRSAACPCDDYEVSTTQHPKLKRLIQDTFCGLHVASTVLRLVWFLCKISKTPSKTSLAAVQLNYMKQAQTTIWTHFEKRTFEIIVIANWVATKEAYF